MSDEQENVGAGSEHLGEYVPDEDSKETTSAENAAAPADATSDASQDAGAQDAGGAADAAESKETPAEPADTAQAETVADPAASTDFADMGLKAGDDCVCPDGRPGSVHRFDAGLVCIPKG
jgi:hypothetical protein